MPRTDYRPQVGEKIFVSLSGNPPILITVTGSHYHSYLKKDVMDFQRLDGSSGWTDPDGQEFFPEIPTDTPFLYMLLFHEDSEDTWGVTVEEGFFFDPESAFELRDAIIKGDAEPKYRRSTDPDDYIIEVRKVS